MKAITEKKIKAMAEAIVREVRPERIILFGSRARGEAGPNSDVDLVVVESKPFGPGRSRRGEMSRLSRALSGFGYPTDLLVYSKAEFEYWSDSLNHVVGRAVREGRTLYEKNRPRLKRSEKK